MIAKKHRIEKSQINYILNKGELITSNLFIIRYIKNDKGVCRFSTILSKKFESKATIRNKIKRQIYEAIRLSLKDLKPKSSTDIIIIPKKNIKEASYEQIEQNIREIIKTNG